MSSRSDVWASRWLRICRHHVRGSRVPFVIVLQHDIVPSRTRIVAPLMPAGAEAATVLTPGCTIGPVAFRRVLQEMAAVALALLGEAVDAADIDPDAVSAGLDAIFRGYPVAPPLA